jgi:hypothetical protein
MISISFYIEESKTSTPTEPPASYLTFRTPSKYSLYLNVSLPTVVSDPGQCHRHGKCFIGRSCKRKAEDLLKLSRLQLKMAVAVLTGYAAVRSHLCIMGLFDGDLTCRFCRMRLKQCSILLAAARCWLVSAVMSLGSCLLNRKI